MTGRRVFLEHTQGGLDFFGKSGIKLKLRFLRLGNSSLTSE